MRKTEQAVRKMKKAEAAGSTTDTGTDTEGTTDEVYTFNGDGGKQYSGKIIRHSNVDGISITVVEYTDENGNTQEARFNENGYEIDDTGRMNVDPSALNEHSLNKKEDIN